MAEATVTKAAKEKVRYTKIEDMTPEDKAAFDKMTPARQEEYMGRLALQDAQDKIHAARDQQAADREAKKAATAKEKSIKEIIKDVKEGTLAATLEAVSPRFAAMTPPLPTEEYDKTLERIKTDSVKRGSSSNIPAKPAYELKHEAAEVEKASIIPPEFSTAADSTLANSVRRYGIISPLLVRESPDKPGMLILMDGKRRFGLIPDGEKVPVTIVSGFPDEDTAERGEVTVNRVRSLNVLSIANSLNRMRTRGIEDTIIRRDMGFKTGEIDKLTSVITNLIPALAEALTAGNITPSVALSIAKLPKGLQNELAKTYADRVKATPQLARIAESDVEGVRQKRAGESAKRDTPTLAGLAGAVNGSDTKAGELDKGKSPNVSSTTKAAPKAGSKK